MEFLAALGLAAAFAYLVSAIGGNSLDRAVGAIAKLVGGWTPDGWPRGVQEENRDQPWGRPAPLRLTGRPTLPEIKPKLERVHASTSHR